jgi:tetratricopeptide (TPR) repeat protein
MGRSYLLAVGIVLCLFLSCTSKKEKALQYLATGKEKMYNNDLPGAMADFEKAVEYDPGLDQAWYYRANMKYNDRDIEGALKDYDECIRISPGFADAYANRGTLKLDRGDREGACADFHKAKDLGKENITERLQNCP